MRLSESLRRNILDASGSRIVNRFRIPRRRDVMFFDSILSGYIRDCEEAGHGVGMASVAREWGFLYTDNFMPPVMRNIPKHLLLNRILSGVWRNIGLLDSFHASLDRNGIMIEVSEEGITRTIGRNAFCEGMWSGVLGSLFGKGMRCTESRQDRHSSFYSFEFHGNPVTYPTKDMQKYNRLNGMGASPGGEPGMKKQIRTGSISMRENRMSFRGRPILLGENTLFHLLGQSGIRMDSLSGISEVFFRELLDPGASVKDRLMFLKSMLQTFGWGRISIITGDDAFSFVIANPPFGIQKSDDDWSILVRMIQGFIASLGFGPRFRGSRLSGGRFSFSLSCS